MSYLKVTLRILIVCGSVWANATPKQSLHNSLIATSTKNSYTIGRKLQDLFQIEWLCSRKYANSKHLLQEGILHCDTKSRTKIGFAFEVQRSSSEVPCDSQIQVKRLQHTTEDSDRSIGS